MREKQQRQESFLKLSLLSTERPHTAPLDEKPASDPAFFGAQSQVDFSPLTTNKERL